MVWRTGTTVNAYVNNAGALVPITHSVFQLVANRRYLLSGSYEAA